MEESLRRKICQLVAGIVVSDDDLDPAEEAFVDRMLLRFNIPEKDRDVIFPIVDNEEAVEKMRELPEEVQKDTLDLLVQAAAADGKIVPQERDYLKAVAAAIGTSERELAELVAKHL